MFGYCTEIQSWTFSYTESGDACDDWVARSQESASFDVLDTAGYTWQERDLENRTIIIDHIHMSCLDCEHDEINEIQGECLGRGTCSDAVCECDEGNFGIRCEFYEPCEVLEIDIRFDGFRDTREWSTTFDIFELEDVPIYAYNRPVYVNERKPSEFDIVVFTGRRWMATHTSEF